MRTAATVGALSLAGCNALGGNSNGSTPTNPEEAARAGLDAEGSWSKGVRSIERSEDRFTVQYNFDRGGSINHHVAEERGSSTAINVLAAVADVELDAAGIDVTAFITTESGNRFPFHEVGASAETVADVDWETVESDALYDHVDEYQFHSAPF